MPSASTRELQSSEWTLTDIRVMNINPIRHVKWKNYCIIVCWSRTEINYHHCFPQSLVLLFGVISVRELFFQMSIMIKGSIQACTIFPKWTCTVNFLSSESPFWITNWMIWITGHYISCYNPSREFYGSRNH